MATAAPAATIVPASASVDQTNAWLQGLKRIVMPAIALAPFLFEVLIEFVNQGQVVIPKQYAGLWAALMLALQLYNKARLAQEQQAGAAALKSEGLPVGVPLSPPILERALFTESKLPTPPPST